MRGCRRTTLGSKKAYESRREGVRDRERNYKRRMSVHVENYNYEQ